MTDVQRSETEEVQKIASIIKDIKFAMVTTMNSDQHMQSCPLTTQQVEFDGDLWFIVGRNSEVAANIRLYPQVNASFSGDGNYLSVSGFAGIVEDRQKLEELWSDVYQIWFKGGINDPNVALLKVHVENAEYWQSPSLAVTRFASFAKAFLTKDKSSLGEHAKLRLN